MSGIKSGIDIEKKYNLSDAAKMVKERAIAKFDETIDVSINLNIDPKQSDQLVRGTVVLPKGSGKKVRVAVFAKDDKAKEAEQAGADIVGSEDLAEKVEKGEIKFDRVIATPDMMVVVGKLGKVLGPKGLMPNPKLGTVTPNITEAIKAAKGGQIEFKTDKGGVVHAGVGKASFSPEDIEENIKTLILALKKLKPTSHKGTYIDNIHLSSTMGPSIKVSEVVTEVN
mgnify:CR=1 FL=1